MSGSVVERFGTTIVDGLIHHDDRSVAWADADQRAGFRLDRRKAWAFIEGRLGESVRWVQSCSGCSYGFESRGGGCDECGYHGVVRCAMWMPYDRSAGVRGRRS